MRTGVNLLPTMNSRDRVDDNNISFMFNASNISWHIIMKTTITITAFDQDENEAKGRRNKRTEPDSNLTCATSKLSIQQY